MALRVPGESSADRSGVKKKARRSRLHFAGRAGLPAPIVQQSMKTPLVFVCGAAVGALAMWLASPGSKDPAGEVVAGKPSAGQTERGSKGGSPQDGMRSAKTARPETAGDDDGDDAIVLDEDDEDSPEMAQVRETMAKELVARKQRRIDERVAALKTRLNLDDAQTAKVRTLLESGDEEEDMLSKVIAGESSLPPAAGEAAKKRAELEGQISALLKPDQVAAYGEFRQEQRENRVEVATGREMTRLQQSLTLSPGQKDQVYEALGTIATGEEERGDTGISIDPSVLKARRQARLDALKPILTPEQYEAYEKSSIYLIDMEAGAMSIEGQEEE